jgi:secreted trypsin-like serine protease
MLVVSRLASVSLLVLAAACTVAPAGEEQGESGSAIVGGTETSGFMGIGYLEAVGKSADGKTWVTNGTFCTASLIAPDVVLTAAHCTDGIEKVFEGSGYVFDHIGFGVGKVGGSKTTKATQVVAHPGYGGGESADMTHDIAYLVLEKSVAGVKPLTLQRTRHLGSCEYVATGYGVSKDGYERGTEPPAGSVGVRKALVVCSNKGLVEGMIETYSDQGSQCSGDSGGPLRVRNTDRIVGVVSFATSAKCEANGREYYAPVASNLSFIDEGLASSRTAR